MLRLLNISNLAVVDNLQIEFSAGLNVLSGETGSGKSIVIDALGVLSGNRVNQEVIRTGADRSYVEGVFDVAGNTPLLALLADSGIAVDDDEIVIKREISMTGRGRIFVNNQTATLSLLKQIQPHIIDIHGQGDQQSLLLPDNHLKIFDSFVGASPLRHQVEQQYEEILNLLKELESSHRSEAERLQLLDLLEYQIAEITKAELTPSEDSDLEAERNILANAERLMLLSNEAYKLLYDDEQSILAQLSLVSRRLDELAKVDGSFSNHRDQVINVRYNLEDASYFLRGYLESIDVSPERLRWIEERLNEIDKLKRKYGNSVEAVLQTLADLEARTASLKNDDERANSLLDTIHQVVNECDSLAGKLSEVRALNSKKFEKLAHKELSEVTLEHARFQVCFNLPPNSGLRERISRFSANVAQGITFGRHGKESIEFYFSANVGEELKPIREVASGGELSRLMLILKTIIAPTQFPRTLIFDEVDTGIGGRVADAVGVRLRKLAGANQVLCVTHQAQIARYADTHFLVIKTVDGRRTTTSIRELDQLGKIDELARMLAGNEITTTAKKHARELLKIS
jgi:DNA repair protein RecN (Recombination protein N)